MKIVTIIIVIFFASCQKSEQIIYTAQNDAEIKQIVFEHKLSSLQVFELLKIPLNAQIKLNIDSFQISKHELKLCLVSQIILESGYLRSDLLQINNILGIKKLKLRPFFRKQTTEYIKGKKVIKTAKFSSFYSIEDCLHNYFTIMKGKRFLPVRKAINTSDYCFELQKCGYATDPAYSYKLQQIIKTLKFEMTPDVLGAEFNN